MKIGVAGPNAAGKGEVVRLLERRSFYRASLSDVIRGGLAKEGLEPTREHMIERGRQLRERFGQAVLAERVQRTLPSDRNHVIDSIRHPAEVEALREGGDFLLLWVDAEPQLRFERSRARGRGGDATDFAGFQALEARELASDDRAAQQLLAVRALADLVVRNDGDLAQLETRLEEVLRDRLFFRERPPWDEYFMNIARVVASRSNCIKRNVRAAITPSPRTISASDKATPPGPRDSYKVGSQPFPS